MELRLTLILEILSVIICLYRIYGRKVKFDIKTIILFLSLLITLDIMNFYQLSGQISWIVYVMIFVYCKCRFKESITKTVVNIILFIIILTIIQFICVWGVEQVIPDNTTLRNIVGNIAVLCVCIWGLPILHIENLKVGIHKKTILIKVVFGFMLLVILAFLWQGKVLGEIQLEFFVLAIPAVVLLLLVFMRWTNALEAVENIEKEIENTISMKQKYEEFIEKIRMRQHEFKNHLSTIYSLHYTYKTYDRLVKAQEEYCNQLLEDNKFNNLLQVEDNILIGFLYGKFEELESDGISIEYKIGTRHMNYAVPKYNLIEMLGILLDNAAEASLNMSGPKTIQFEITENEESYQFFVRNKCNYVSYMEMEEWFRLGKSQKGMDRGIGLYHLKCLCAEWQCDICCRNIKIENDNWIEFGLQIKKDRMHRDAAG